MQCPECGAQFEPPPALKVGDVLYGFCHGTFGRDSYGEKTVIAIGPDWVLVSEMVLMWKTDEWVRILHAYSGDPNDLLEYTRPEDPDTGTY